MNDLEQRVLSFVDTRGLVDCLCELISFPSEGGEETPAQRRMAELMGEMGMEVDTWALDLDELRRDPAYTVEIERSEALGVVGRIGGAGPKLVLNGHIDVVPAGDPDQWSTPPWQGTVRDGKVYGRGAVDMKGGLCCGLYAVQAVIRAGVELDGTVLLQSVVGEEDGGLGTLAAIRRGHLGDAAIVLEPTAMTVAPAHAGAFNFRVIVSGRAAHGALRGEGVDAIDKFVQIYRALQALEQRRNARPIHPLFRDYDIPYALCVGKLHAGVWSSTVADSLVAEGRYGIAVDEDPDAARRELEEAVLEAATADPWLRENPPRVEWWGAQFHPAITPEDHPVVRTVTGALQDLSGNTPAVRGMPYGADMRLLVNEGGIPAVLFGPGNVRLAHATDEFVPVEELEAVTRALALSILRFCTTR